MLACKCGCLNRIKADNPLNYQPVCSTGLTLDMRVFTVGGYGCSSCMGGRENVHESVHCEWIWVFIMHGWT